MKLVVADSLDIVVRDGEALGIVGPNGAGKSTLFAMIAGELRVDGGTIELDGRRCDPAALARAHADGHRPHLSRSLGLSTGMTVFENILVLLSRERVLWVLREQPRS